MQVRQSVVLSVNEDGVRRVQDKMVSVPEKKSLKPDKAPSKSRAFNTSIAVHENDMGHVIISSSRRESTSPGRIESQKHKHAHRPYWNSDRRPTH